MTTTDHILLWDYSDKRDHVKISTYEKWRDEQKIDEIANFTCHSACNNDPFIEGNSVEN